MGICTLREGPRLAISEVKMRDYRTTARIKEQQRKLALEQRLLRVRQLAHVAAGILCDEFAAQRVMLFGSATQPRLFHLRSDIDLAVWGLLDATYYQALARLLDACRPFDVHLVQMEHAQPTLYERVQKEGEAL